MVHVRLATPDDAPAIAALALEVQEWHVAGRPDIFKPGGCDASSDIVARIDTDDHFYWVAVADGVIIGYAYARVVDEPENRWKYASRIVVLDQMGVTARSRRVGAGARLWDAVRALAIGKRADRVVLNVWAFNGSARDFYERVGFTPFHERLAVELPKSGAANETRAGDPEPGSR